VKIDLFSMVFGESVLNDAVAIVLSRTLLSFNEPGAVVDGESIMNAVIMFLTIFGGSLAIGAMYGIASSLVFKSLGLGAHGDSHLFLEAGISFVFPWCSYFTAEALSLSGIVTILFCGMIMAIYTKENFSESAKKLTSQGYKVAAFIAETYVFVYLGMSVFTFPIFNHTVWLLVGAALLACFVGRLHIYIGSWIFNCFRTEDSTPPKISGRYMFVMWFSGLRGGVAFALASVSYVNKDFDTKCGGYDMALEKQESIDKFCSISDSQAILQTTLVIATFTIFVFGGAITSLCMYCEVLEDGTAHIHGDLDGHVQTAEYPELPWMVKVHHACMMPWLTAKKVAHAVQEKTSEMVEFASPMPSYQKMEEPETELAAEPAPEPKVAAPEPVTPTSAIKAAQGEGMSLDDKLDELRAAFPGQSTAFLQKLLQEVNNDLGEAIALGKRGD
jgi:NhaP-type Na+/H+ or K+/H+ antiporter